MKKSLIAIAVLAASGAAMAQSSVTLYGKVDAWLGVVDTDGQAKQTVVGSGNMAGSRWGMRGSEDLGGGLKANFTLESGIDVDTGAAGQGGLLFGRQAWVGLSGGFGDVQVGRVRSASHIVVGDYNGVFDSAIFSPLSQIGRVNDNGNRQPAIATGLNTGTSLRFNNAISYTSPTMGGFNARVQYALGENKTNATSADAAYALNVNYAGGPLKVGAFYQVESCEQATASANATRACTGGNDDRKYTFVGASYNFGVAVLKGSFGKSQDIAGRNNADSDEYQIGVDFPVSSALTLSASYAAASDNQTQSRVASSLATGEVDRKGFGVGAKYDLSKRTFLYGGITKFEQTNAGTNNSDTTVYGLGVQHNF